MPELPEVETIRKQLKEEIVGGTIEEVWYDRPKLLKPNPKTFAEGVVGKEISDVRRRAKLLIFVLGGSKDKLCDYIICHLRLSGRLLVRRKSDTPDDYVHVILKFKGGKELRFAEARLFGYMQYLPDQTSLDKILEKHGPEPLDDLDAGSFYQILQKTRKPVKLTLLDQGLISGVGNIYANDALFLAGIHPKAPANSLTEAQAEKLLRAIETVFKEGLKYGGASDQWYRQVHGEKGSYQEHFKVYGRVGQACDRCGARVQRINLGGRGTFYCSKCQPEP